MQDELQQMGQQTFASLSLVELRHAIKARADDLKSANSWNLEDVLNYLVALPDNSHTSDSVDVFTQLARNFFYAGRFGKMLEAASYGSRFSRALGNKLQLGRARDKEGAALIYLGRFAEATVAEAEVWSLARELSDRRLEMFAIWGMGDICTAMGQWNEAIRYYKRVHQLAEEVGAVDYEIAARTLIAESAIQLRNPDLGLQALSKVAAHPPPKRTDTVIHGGALAALTHLYLQIGDVTTAREFSERAMCAAVLGDDPMTIQKCHASKALVSVRSGNVEEGLAALKQCLAIARSKFPSLVPGFLNMCIDAYEAAGLPDDSLAHLQELVDWKRTWIEAAVIPHQYVELPQSPMTPTLDAAVDQGLIAKSHFLHAGIRFRVQGLVETAVNAELARGYGIYRIFRISRLASQLAEGMGWNLERVSQLSLGARLCGVGMLAVPSHLLQKSSDLSDVERQLVRDHARYGGELLRRSNLRLLEMGALIAEQYRERHDGSGYPHGLRGDAIVEEARLVSVCDAFDAMTHSRPWRSTIMSSEAALQELRRCAGSQFDPSFAEAFIESFRREFSGRADLDIFLAREAEEFEYVRALARMEASLRC
jgi:putative two-component system response regulator